MGNEIRVGDHIVYVKSWANKDIEEAVVTECEPSFIRVEYLGKGSPKRYSFQKKKPAGKKSKFTATDKKVIIIHPGAVSSTDRDIFEKARRDLLDKIKKIESQHKEALERERSLQRTNRLLQAEVEKIHKRWDILDL